MKTINPSISTKPHYSGYAALWASMAFEGVVAIIGLLQVPSEPGSAVWLGFSRLRLLTAGAMLVLIVLLGGLALAARAHSPLWQRLSDRARRITATPKQSFGVFVYLFSLFVVILALLGLFVSPAGTKSNILHSLFARTGLVLIWVDLILLQLGLLVYFKAMRKDGLHKQRWGRFTRDQGEILVAIAAFVFAVALRVYMGIMGVQDFWLMRMALYGLAGIPLAWGAVQLVRNRETAWVAYLWTGLLFVGGAVLWGWFINWGQGPYEYHDWSEITMPRLTVVQDAVRHAVLPLHISDYSALNGMVDRIMGTPDILLSPQVLLLRWMEIGPFLVLNTLLSYAAGFAGLLAFSRRRRLSVLAFTVLFLLFNFNGHQVAHLSVGHYTWTAYFLFPWLVNFIFDLIDGKTGWKWVLNVSLLFFVMFLQGGYHHFVYSLFLLALVAVAIRRHFWLIAKTMVFSVLLSAVRLYPVALNVAAFDDHIKFKAGYPSLMGIVDSLVRVFFPSVLMDYEGLTGILVSHEFSFYVSLTGALFLVIFGVIMVVKNRSRAGSYAALLLPAFGMVLLSLDKVYRYLETVLSIPPFSGERVASRFISLGILLILALAVIEFQRWYENRKASLSFIVTCTGAALVLAHDLWQNVRMWQVIQAMDEFEAIPFDPAKWTVANHADPEYLNAIWVGAMVSLVTLIVLVLLNVWKKPARVRSR